MNDQTDTAEVPGRFNYRPPMDADGDAPWRKALNAHAYILPVFGITLLICTWLITQGDWTFASDELFCGFYDAQAKALLEGRLEVSKIALQFEWFTRDHQHFHGYFGIAPAILRFPLVLLFPKGDGHWSRIIMLVAMMVNLVCAYRLVLMLHGGTGIETRCRRVVNALFILSAGLGSTIPFILSRSYTYHEAILLSGTFALLFVLTILCYFKQPGLGRLILAIAFCFMSFHSRTTAGAGALLCVGVVAAALWLRVIRGSEAGATFIRFVTSSRTARIVWPVLFAVPLTFMVVYFATIGGIETALFLLFTCVLGILLCFRFLRDETGGKSLLGIGPISFPMRHAVVASAGILFILGVYFVVNWGRFRTLDGCPVKYYGLYHANPARMLVTDGKQIHLENFPTGFASYFLGGISFRSEFPWVFLPKTPIVVGSPSLDLVEPYSSLPISMPALFTLAILGIRPVFGNAGESLKRVRLPIFAMFVGGSVVLFTVGITQRYLHDYYPFLIIAGAAGAARVAASTRKFHLRLLVPLTIIAILFSLAFAIEFQRVHVWGLAGSDELVKEKQEQFQRVRRMFDRWFHHEPVRVPEEHWDR